MSSLHLKPRRLKLSYFTKNKKNKPKKTPKITTTKTNNQTKKPVSKLDSGFTSFKVFLPLLPQVSTPHHYCYTACYRINVFCSLQVKKSAFVDQLLLQTVLLPKCREKNTNIHQYCMLLLMKRHKTERQVSLSLLFNFCFSLESRYIYPLGHCFKSDLHEEKKI